MYYKPAAVLSDMWYGTTASCYRKQSIKRRNILIHVVQMLRI